MSDQIQVTFPQVQATQEHAQQTVTNMNQSLSDLKSFLAPMVAEWQGQAAENYNAKQAQWDQAANDLNEVLAAISRAVGSANEGFQSTENSNAQRFGA